jgi:autotransporter adhesin
MLYRQLQKVAAGQVSATSTDAVNGSQLYVAYEAIDSVVDTATQHSDRITELEFSEVIQNAAILDNSKEINGLNQRLDRTNTRLDRVGAGAAALAALHPLEYDPDDKLTFSAGMGNYSGENAAALGAFYRPNEKFMVSLGGTMGNGENMVNVGMSIGLDKPNGFAKMSKRELIQEVVTVKAENEVMKAEMLEMKAMLQKLLAQN